MEEKEVMELPKAGKKGPITVHLSEPIEWGDNVIKEITFKAPKAKHVKHIDPKSVTIGQLLAIGSKLSGVSASVFDELCMEDMNKVIDAVSDLL